MISFETTYAPTLELEDEQPTITPSNWPTTNGGVPLDPAIEAQIDVLLDAMTVEEMVGQVIQADIAFITPDELRTYRLGAVLNGGNSAPNSDVRAPAEAWLALVDEFHAASMDTTNDRKAIPLLWGTDAVHGHNNVVGATIFPHNIGLGATRNPSLIRQIGAVTAREVLATGMDWTFAPTLAVVRNDRWGRTYEGYSEDPEIIAAYAAAMVEGLQGKMGTKNFLNNEHVLATAKHFLGDGGTRDGKDQGDNYDSEADLRDKHGAGYPPAIEAGVQTVMASFSTWHGEKLHGSKQLLTDVLKERMRFNGFVVGDWNGHGQVEGCSNDQGAASFNAGLDMFMAAEGWKGLYYNTIGQVRDGTITRERLHEAVRRILRVKLRMGLFNKPTPSARHFAGDFSLLGAPEHLAVARQAVRESLVLLKNQGGLLPLHADQRILVAGDGADDIGKLCGGWTLSWQGTGNTKAHFPNGSSIWEGIQEAVRLGGGEAEISIDGSYSQRPDVAIVVFGEDPYAEFMGDVEHLDFESEAGLQLLRSFKNDGIPTVAIFLSGRPMWVNPELNAADAFVAAWLPGTQGSGVADVIIRTPTGAVNHDFKGKLSYSWPRTADQTPLNRGDFYYDPLFSYGFGLTYADYGDLAVLSEYAGNGKGPAHRDVFFTSGRAAASWQLEGRSGGLSVPVVDARTQVSDALSIRSVDRNTQEDAKQAIWHDQGGAAIYITGLPADCMREANADMALAIQYRVDTPPTEAVFLFLVSDEGERGNLDVTHLFTNAVPGTWTQVDIKLNCFAKTEVNFARLAVPFGLETTGRFAISLSDIRLLTNEGRAICP